MRVIAVIPSLSERTTDIAVQLVKNQVGNVVVLDNYSRAESIRRAWEVSRDFDYLVWTPTDLLIRPGFIRNLLDELIQSGKDRIVSRCVSKFRGLTVGGVTIQKTYKNDELIKAIKGNWNSLRPESNTALKLLSNVKSDIMIGYHEYFLDYDEIYMRYQHHRKKHKNQVLSLVKNWQPKVKNDRDYEAAISGVRGLPLGMDSKGALTKVEIEQIYAML